MIKNNIVVHILSDLEDLIPNFLENRNKDIANIQKAIQNNDFGEIESIGHILKGVGGSYGFQTISELGADIERDAGIKDVAKIKQHKNILIDYLSRVVIVYKKRF